ncbi:MAG: GatB/YqeY domain-containing protein [Eikenella sp.]|nr:GatB/YqeY domain-containing protein [Eikenella sp.]
MSLKTRLNEDMKAALKAKDQAALSTIRLANAEIKRFEVDERIEADDAKVVAILGKMIKQRKDSAAIYSQAGRQELADKELAEIAILQVYLPEMLSAAAIEAAVAAAIAETGAAGMADMGKVMALLKIRLAGQADMAEVSRLLKAALNH